VKADEKLYERIAWPMVYKRLRSLAGWLTRGRPAVFDGVSKDDLVGETILEFLNSENALGWNPARGELEPFLCAVLKNKYLDHIRRLKYNGGPITGPMEDRLAVSPHVDRLEQHQLVNIVEQRVRGDKELEALVVAIQETEGTSRLNQELADRIGTSVADVVNRRKRIRRSFRNHPLQPPASRKEPETR
jgi:DNA-directed RNA polymerase specialized sigma24 family protein